MECILRKVQKAEVLAFVIALLAVAFLALATPAHAGIFDGLVPCGNMSVSGSPTSDVITTGECTVCHYQILLQNILNFLIAIMVAVAALLFANAGVLYVLAPASPANVAKAHKLFMNTLVGIVIILSSWLLVDFAMKSLLADGEVNSAGPWNAVLCPSSPGALADLGTTEFESIEPTLIVSDPHLTPEERQVIIDERINNPTPTNPGNPTQPNNPSNPTPTSPPPPSVPLTPQEECTDLYQVTLGWFDASPDDLYEYRSQFDAAGARCTTDTAAAYAEILTLRSAMSDDRRVKDEPCWQAVTARRDVLLPRSEVALQCVIANCPADDIAELQVASSITRIRFPGYYSCAQANSQYDRDNSNIRIYTDRCSCPFEGG